MMKKLLPFLAVANIVTCVLAFTSSTTGLGTFCVKFPAANQCVIVTEKKIDINGTQFGHYPLGPNEWDGTKQGCLNATCDDCDVPIHLLDN